MARVLTNGEISIGAFVFPDRKKPCIGVEKGNECLIYGSFHNIESATAFMKELAALVGAKEE